jgi:hypothetical protein
MSDWAALDERIIVEFNLFWCECDSICFVTVALPPKQVHKIDSPTVIMFTACYLKGTGG